MTAIPAAPAPAWRQRLKDMRALVRAFDPDAEPPWVLEPLVIPGTLAVVAGQGGAGKTWVMHEAAHAVSTATSGAGLRPRTAPARALIIDAEMGEWLTVQRFAQQRYSLDIDVMDATGLNLNDAASRQIIWDAIVELKPSFVGFDSLAALTAGADENGKETGDLLNWVREVMQKTQAAGLMIHHAGWKEERTRGSSTIRDRADAVWYFKRYDDAGTRELNCDGAALKAPRWGRPPKPVYMRLCDRGGLEHLPDGPPPKPEEVKAQSEAERLRAAVARGEIRTRADACLAVGREPTGHHQKTMRDLLRQIDAHEVDGVWSLNGAGPAI